MNSTNDISIEQLLGMDNSQPIGYHRDIVMINKFSNLNLFSHPARLRATSVLVCLKGHIDCSVNLKKFHIAENHLLVSFAGDIIQIHETSDSLAGYAILISEDYLQQLKLDFRLRIQNYISLRDNCPVSVPYEELSCLKPYYTLLKKNIADDNPDVINGLTLAISYTVISLMKRYRPQPMIETNHDTPRTQQLFDRFMNLLDQYHTKERSLQFYASKMFLTPKYVSRIIKEHSGKGALEWINTYVIIEAKMMLRYTDKTIQEIAYLLNFPSQSAFGKYFKNIENISPKRYRTVNTRPI